MNGLLNAGLYFVVSVAVILVALFIFDLVTKYKIWSEIQKGNAAVALATGGIVLGLANIIHDSITTNNKLTEMLLWGGVGCVALVAVYFLFELLTFKINVSNEIQNGNRAVGMISFIFSVAASVIIGACIS